MTPTVSRCSSCSCANQTPATHSQRARDPAWLPLQRLGRAVPWASSCLAAHQACRDREPCQAASAPTAASVLRAQRLSPRFPLCQRTRQCCGWGRSRGEREDQHEEGREQGRRGGGSLAVSYFTILLEYSFSLLFLPHLQPPFSHLLLSSPSQPLF